MKEKDLQIKFQSFSEIIDIFEKIGIDYFIGGNVLLGIMRTGDFIPRRLGTSIAIKFENYEKNIKNISDELLKKDFKFNEKKSELRQKIVAVKADDMFEITPWYKSGKWRIRKKYILPNKYFKAGHFENLRGRSFQTFNSPVRYLKFRFGETWTTEIDSLNRKKFENPRYWRDYKND